MVAKEDSHRNCSEKTQTLCYKWNSSFDTCANCKTINNFSVVLPMNWNHNLTLISIMTLRVTWRKPVLTTYAINVYGTGDFSEYYECYCSHTIDIITSPHCVAFSVQSAGHCSSLISRRTSPLIVRSPLISAAHTSCNAVCHERFIELAPLRLLYAFHCRLYFCRHLQYLATCERQ